jgi:multisubunit Na+/H+ antiporter MnhE subunit
MNQAITLLAQALLNVAAEATGHGTGPLPLGYIVVGIIQAPVIILLLATFLGKPRQPRITGVFIGFIAMMVIVFISTVFGLSYLLSIFY